MDTEIKEAPIRGRILWRFAAVAYALLLLALSVMTVPDDVPSVAGIDKVFHFCAYGGLGWLIVKNIKNGLSLTATVAVAFVLSFSYGAVIEFWQQYVGRDASVADAVANGLGALAGAYVAWRWI